MSDAYLISWRPTNFWNIGLMLAVWIVIYIAVSQGVRRVSAGNNG